MIHKRPFWLRQIHRGWKKRPIVWLSGVRRAGKTTLVGMLEGAVYMNCELPSVARTLEDPEYFYDTFAGKLKIMIFDEIHRLEDPSLVLKIAADHYPNLKILATGSSTLAATKKFRDALTGRKHTVYLPPVLWTECMEDFGIRDLDLRLLRGGLPEALLADSKAPEFFSEWMDSFYARDIQELFRIRNRNGFLKLLQLLFANSGGQLDYTGIAQNSDLSRPTVKSHIEAMSIAHAIFLVPPIHGRTQREIIKRPKVYAFDTGFVTFVRGWEQIRAEDRGGLWEHLVLDELRSFPNGHPIYYWRDKSGREIDFILKLPQQRFDVVECKINPDRFHPDSIFIFRSFYERGNNYIISPVVKTPYVRKFNGLKVEFVSLTHFLAQHTRN